MNNHWPRELRETPKAQLERPMVGHTFGLRGALVIPNPLGVIARPV
jgi:hypothetical protein